VALDPTNADARLALGALLHHDGRMNEALQETLVSLERSPTSRGAASLIATIYKAMGRPDQALVWRDVANQGGDPRERDAGVGDCFLLLGDLKAAEAIYTQSRQLHPELPEGWMGLCRLRLLEGRVEEAREIYQAETKGYADFAFAWQMAAQVEFFGRNFAEAERLYTRLYEQDASGGGAFYGAVSYASALGRLSLESEPLKGRELLERALAVERDAIDAGSENPAVFYRVAAIEASLGRTETALAHLQAAVAAGWLDHRSLKIDPRFDTVREEALFQELLDAMSQRAASLLVQHLSRPNPARSN
jgi:tetratricopeptide (TPR) repeat protein